MEHARSADHWQSVCFDYGMRCETASDQTMEDSIRLINQILSVQSNVWFVSGFLQLTARLTLL